MAEFLGNQFTPGTASYSRANNIYASSTYGKERDMQPGEIYQPTSVEDIQWVVRYANRVGKPIALRSGGHQYSGASSTGAKGIQLDLKPTFRRPKLDLQVIRDTKNDKVFLRSSVSWSLIEVFDFLLDNGIFMPTGQCATVCLGGHVQTGGYGMLGRSFGILGDWIRELEIVDHKGDLVKVTKESQPDLFFGLLGGSPGNIGVLTHFTAEVQDDQKHQGSQGLWIAFHYKRETLKALLDLLVAKSEDANFPRGYDFNINVVSRQTPLADMFPGSPEELKKKLPDFIHDGQANIADLFNFKYALIIVYAQWIKTGDEVYSPDLFNQIQAVPKDFSFKVESGKDAPASRITSMWLFRAPREFPMPYVKRTNSTNSTAVSKLGWADWFAGRVDEIVANKGNGLWISSQLQVFGGTNSMFRKNAQNGTAYTFRDATIIGTWDVFYGDKSAEAAQKWQEQNDKDRPAKFSKEDRRVLWGSYGDWNMKNVWRTYYDETTYQRLQQIRKKADPKGTFTANPFCVEAAK